MTSPTQTAGVGVGLQGAGTLLSFLGAKREGAATKSMFDYQAGIAQLNQKIALQNRDYAIEVGETDAVRYGMAAAQRAGTIRARQGASGIDVGSGSSVDVRESQKMVTDMDLAQIRNNAARKAYGYAVEATQDEAQAGLYTRAGAEAKRAGDIKATGSLISGATGVADKWLQYQTNFGKSGGTSNDDFKPYGPGY